jgi:uncharacterized membrane protein
VTLVVVWLHVLAVIVWIGGLMYQTHVLLPAARRGEAAAFVEAVRRGRRATWTALAVVVLTGFYNVTQLGPVERVMQGGAGVMVAGKFILVIAAITIASQRDFAHLARLGRAVGGAEDPAPVLRAIAMMDRAVLALALVIVYLGLAISRA